MTPLQNDSPTCHSMQSLTPIGHSDSPRARARGLGLRIRARARDRGVTGAGESLTPLTPDPE